MAEISVLICYLDVTQFEPCPKRIENIREEGYFGNHKQVRDHVWELRWENGRRIYYSLIPVSQVLPLLGGNKNGQTKDINQAEKIYKDWIYD